MQRLEGADWFATVPAAALAACGGSPAARDYTFHMHADGDGALDSAEGCVLLSGTVLQREGAWTVVSCGGLLAGTSRRGRRQQQQQQEYGQGDRVRIRLQRAAR